MTVARLASGLLCLILLASGCAIRGSHFDNFVDRDNGKVYSYRNGVVHCPDGRRVPYHPNEYEKSEGFSLPGICYDTMPKTDATKDAAKP